MGFDSSFFRVSRLSSLECCVVCKASYYEMRCPSSDVLIDTDDCSRFLLLLVALNEEGIFRKSGNSIEVEALKLQFDSISKCFHDSCLVELS